MPTKARKNPKSRGFVAINGMAYQIPEARVALVKAALAVLRVALPRVNITEWREVPGSNFSRPL